MTLEELKEQIARILDGQLEDVRPAMQLRLEQNDAIELAHMREQQLAIVSLERTVYF
jgi:hypothetical protein